MNDELLRLAERVFRVLDFLDKRERLVRVKSWTPYWDGKYLCWPSYTVDKPGQRAFVSPCWDRVRCRLLLTKLWRAIQLRSRAHPLKG